MPEKIEDIEIQLLLEALYQRYHYDFRDYALASVKRRLRQAREQLGFAAFRRCRTACCTIPRCCPAAGLSDRAGQRDVSRSLLFPGHPREGGAASADLSVAQGLDRRLQQRRGALFLRHPVPRGRARAAHAVLRDRHQPGRAGRGRSRRSTASTASSCSPRTIGSRAANRRCRTITARPTAAPRSTRPCASASSFPIIAS